MDKITAGSDVLKDSSLEIVEGSPAVDVSVGDVITSAIDGSPTEVNEKDVSQAGALANVVKEVKSAELSPGFRSAAALAGWDDEALLLATFKSPDFPNAGPTACSDRCGRCGVCRERKRDVRTPVSSAGRHQKNRWPALGKNGSPLGRLPMKVLPLLEDNEIVVNSSQSDCTNPERTHLLPSTHQNTSTNEQATTALVDTESEILDARNGPSKEICTESKPATPVCFDQLRDELSCAVCLDICFEPSTVSCGHSFCKNCLQSVLRQCGPRCPKCRQILRSDALRNCPVNTVLWNTIQILFPLESSARAKDREDSPNVASTNSRRSNFGYCEPNQYRISGGNASRSSESRRPSFRFGSELFENPRREAHTPSDTETQTQRRRHAARRERADAQTIHTPVDTERRSPARQERIDAALAHRLHQAELIAASRSEQTVGPLRVQGRSMNASLSSASASLRLRSVASRAGRLIRTRSSSSREEAGL